MGPIAANTPSYILFANEVSELMPWSNVMNLDIRYALLIGWISSKNIRWLRAERAKIHPSHRYSPRKATINKSIALIKHENIINAKMN